MLAGVLQTRHNDVTGALQRRHRGVTGALQGPACKEQEQLQECVEYRRLLLCPVTDPQFQAGFTTGQMLVLHGCTSCL